MIQRSLIPENFEQMLILDKFKAKLENQKFLNIVKKFSQRLIFKIESMKKSDIPILLVNDDTVKILNSLLIVSNLFEKDALILNLTRIILMIVTYRSKKLNMKDFFGVFEVNFGVLSISEFDSQYSELFLVSLELVISFIMNVVESKWSHNIIKILNEQNILNKIICCVKNFSCDKEFNSEFEKIANLGFDFCNLSGKFNFLHKNLNIRLL